MAIRQRRIGGETRPFGQPLPAATTRTIPWAAPSRVTDQVDPQIASRPMPTLLEATAPSTSGRTVPLRLLMAFALCAACGGDSPSTPGGSPAAPSPPPPPSPPQVAAVSVLTAPFDPIGYVVGDTIRVQVTFNENVSVSGHPTLALTICQETRTFAHLGDTNFYALEVLGRRVVSGRGAAMRRERSDRSYAAPRPETSSRAGRGLAGPVASEIPLRPMRPSHVSFTGPCASVADGRRRASSSFSR